MHKNEEFFDKSNWNIFFYLIYLLQILFTEIGFSMNDSMNSLPKPIM